MKTGLVLTPEQVAAYRIRLADPDYMVHAIDCMAGDVVRDLTGGCGSDEPHFQDTGKVPSRKTE